MVAAVLLIFFVTKFIYEVYGSDPVGKKGKAFDQGVIPLGFAWGSLGKVVSYQRA